MTTETAAPPAHRRGRETVLDMLRTLAILFALVLPLFLFHQGGPGSRKHIRPVDPSEAYTIAAQDLGAPAPTTPAGWTPTVVDTETVEGQVRVGYVVHDRYLEYVADRGLGFLREATGNASRVGTDVVGGVTWQLWRNAQGHESLVRQKGPATVLVGGVRETATRAELEQLASVTR